MDFKQKYLDYKKKYYNLFKTINGGETNDDKYERQLATIAARDIKIFEETLASKHAKIVLEYKASTKKNIKKILESIRQQNTEERNSGRQRKLDDSESDKRTQLRAKLNLIRENKRIQQGLETLKQTVVEINSPNKVKKQDTERSGIIKVDSKKTVLDTTAKLLEATAKSAKATKVAKAAKTAEEVEKISITLIVLDHIIRELRKKP